MTLLAARGSRLAVAESEIGVRMSTANSQQLLAAGCCWVEHRGSMKQQLAASREPPSSVSASPLLRDDGHRVPARPDHRLERNRLIERRQPASHLPGQTEQIDVRELTMAGDVREVEDRRVPQRDCVRPEVGARARWWGALPRDRASKAGAASISDDVSAVRVGAEPARSLSSVARGRSQARVGPSSEVGGKWSINRSSLCSTRSKRFST